MFILGYSCAYVSDILVQGSIYISPNWFCFHSKILGFKTEVSWSIQQVVTPCWLRLRFRCKFQWVKSWTSPENEPHSSFQMPSEYLPSKTRCEHAPTSALCAVCHQELGLATMFTARVAFWEVKNSVRLHIKQELPRLAVRLQVSFCSGSCKVA